MFYAFCVPQTQRRILVTFQGVFLSLESRIRHNCRIRIKIVHSNGGGYSLIIQGYYTDVYKGWNDQQCGSSSIGNLYSSVKKFLTINSI